jgi:hypothetical protein
MSNFNQILCLYIKVTVVSYYKLKEEMGKEMNLSLLFFVKESIVSKNEKPIIISQDTCVVDFLNYNYLANTPSEILEHVSFMRHLFKFSVVWSEVLALTINLNSIMHQLTIA